MVNRPSHEFDGIADFYVKDLKQFTDAFEDDYFRDVVAPDELMFVDVEKTSTTIGYEYIVLENAEKVQSHARAF